MPGAGNSGPAASAPVARTSTWLPKKSGFGPVMLPVPLKELPSLAATPFKKIVTDVLGLAGLAHEFREPSLFSATAAKTTSPV